MLVVLESAEFRGYNRGRGCAFVGVGRYRFGYPMLVVGLVLCAQNWCPYELVEFMGQTLAHFTGRLCGRGGGEGALTKKLLKPNDSLFERAYGIRKQKYRAQNSVRA